MPTLKRIRDPVHGLITFDLQDEVDRAAWALINTPEFQRLRRVKQLGVSEFTFPGATHTRFAHSIGVFHCARELMRAARRYIPPQEHIPHRARTALIAALVHDVGHGPFSHTFEGAERIRLATGSGRYKSHEEWTAEVISNRQGNIRRVLTEIFGGGGSISDDIADLLTNDPKDLYAAVVSSSFDADRLDYLSRDRMMTGSGAGAIDFHWLLDNLRVVNVPVTSAEDFEEDSGETIQTFAFEEKALQAAEAFILARYHLYTQVYFHRTTRGIEQLLSRFLLLFAKEATRGKDASLPVNESHPLRVYYSVEKPSLSHYMALDDAVVWSAIEACASCSPEQIREIADRLANRKIARALTIDTINPTSVDTQRRKYIEDNCSEGIGTSIFEDRVPLSIYKDPKREAIPPHKRIYIRRNDGTVVDVTSLSKPIKALNENEDVLRYYFLDDTIRKKVVDMTGGRNGA